MSIHPFDYTSFSQIDPSKSRNGDACAVEFLEAESLGVFVVSDGVGGAPCDWKASALGCSRFLHYFIENGTGAEIDVRLRAAIERTNAELLHEDGPCRGLQATLSVVVWDYGAGQLSWVSIGDSRVYWLTGGGLVQKSKDQNRALLARKPDGTTFIHAGAAVVRTGLTNALGDPNLHIDVHTEPDAGVYGLLLATDGFHSLAVDFQTIALELLNASNLVHGAEKAIIAGGHAQTDDMTAVAVRRNDIPRAANFTNLTLLPPYLQREVAALALEQAIRARQADQCRAIFGQLENLHLVLDRERCALLIAHMRAASFDDYPTYQALVTYMRRSIE